MDKQWRQATPSYILPRYQPLIQLIMSVPFDFLKLWILRRFANCLWSLQVLNPPQPQLKPAKHKNPHQPYLNYPHVLRFLLLHDMSLRSGD